MAGVRGPREGGHPLREGGAHLTGGEVLREEPVLPEARRIRAEQQGAIVVADRHAPQAEERQTLGQFVLVEQDLLGGLLVIGAALGRLPTALDGVLLALLGPGVVVERPATDRHAEVRLLDAAQHLLVEDLGKGLEILRHGLGVGILRVEIGHDLGIRLLPKPEPRIVHLLPMPRADVRLLGGDWGLRGIGGQEAHAGKPCGSDKK